MIKIEKMNHNEYNNICMKVSIIYGFLILFFLSIGPLCAQVTPVDKLNYDDEAFNALLKSTTASKNRMIKKERLDEYLLPHIYRYTIRHGEDIWTIIAKTSLNIESITTLNRFDFIGMVREEREVYLPDTLGLFFDASEYDREDLAQRLSVEPDSILLLENPIENGSNFYFVAERELPFIERTYIMGVVFHAPLMGVKTSGYGTRIDPFVNEETFHGGVDIAAEEGRIVRAARSGKVIYANISNDEQAPSGAHASADEQAPDNAQASSGYGNLIILEHEFGYYTFYGHLKEISVDKEETVETGQALGKVGMTGKTTGPHLHFEIRRYNKPLNPEDIPFFLFHREPQ